MSGRLFVSQAALDAWAEQGVIELEGNVLRPLAVGAPGLALEPAVRFVGVIGAERDPNALAGTVKSAERLRELGAESLGDSVVLGDVAYEVQPGFLAVPEGPAGRAQAGPAAEASDATSLARFLVENLA